MDINLAARSDGSSFHLLGEPICPESREQARCVSGRWVCLLITTQVATSGGNVHTIEWGGEIAATGSPSRRHMPLLCGSIFSSHPQAMGSGGHCLPMRMEQRRAAALYILQPILEINFGSFV
eukprot:scaffold118515_cov28-Tisochrysis_lutea.AAC.7